ncbi:DNA polymerase II, partial [Escherichia coli]|nr:DNA polymerase II [Escherichia coli]
MQFDLRRLQKQVARSRIPLRLGRVNSELACRDAGSTDGDIHLQPQGRPSIDGIEAVKSAFWNFSSFSLETVAQGLLGEGKSID